MSAVYTVRITGPDIDHAVLVSSVEDLEALELILEKIHRALQASEPPDRKGQP
jgi:hypothetical protein